MVQIAFLRRLLGLGRSNRSVEVPVGDELPPPQPLEPEPITWVACPNCGAALDPPPEHTRLCPRCRRQIVVRHTEGRAVYLTEAAVEVFETERQREIDEQTWTSERRKWLYLAQLVGAPADRRQRVAAAPLTAAAATSSRALYLVAAERAVRAARRDKRWDEVARIRQRQAAALYEEAGGSPPPAAEIVALYQEGVAATLRALTEVSRDAELVGARCCAACRSDNGRIFRITDALRTPRLPHPGCPHGLCSCDWWPAVRKPATKRRRPRASTPPPDVAADAPEADAKAAAADAAAPPAEGDSTIPGGAADSG